MHQQIRELNHSVFLSFLKDNPSKCYIGMTNNSPRRKRYLGSGKLMLRAIKKYGAKSFDKVILGNFDTREEAFFWEGFYIKLYKTESKYGGYNLHPNGGVLGHTQTEEARKKIREGVSKALKGRKPSKESIKKMLDSRRGYRHAEETKRKIGNSHRGMKYNMSEEGSRAISESVRDRNIKRFSKKDI